MIFFRVALARKVSIMPFRIAANDPTRFSQAGTLVALARGPGYRADPLLNESQFFYRQGAEHERIKIVQAHAAIDGIYRKRERQPRFDEAIHAGVERMKIEYRAGTLRQFRTDLEACDVRSFEGVDHVKVVRPGFGKILPRMCARIRQK